MRDAFMELTLGNTSYIVATTEQNGEFTAHAVRAESGERFGIETTASSAEEAENRMARWLQWQHEHAQALEALQQAERVYHRAMTDAAFSTQTDSGSADAARASLESVDAARTYLDDVRARRPTV